MPISFSVPLRRYYGSRYTWRFGAALMLAYVAIYEISSHFLPSVAQLHPATAIAIALLFFTGMSWWTGVYIAALAACALAGLPILQLLLDPIAITLQAVAGTYLLDRARIDPLFRRYRDTFYFIAVAVAIALFSPLLALLDGDMPHTLASFGSSYAAELFCLIIILPLILRWLTKPRFSRTALEILEIGAVFLLLIGTDYVLFIGNVQVVGGVQIVYLLLIPLFFIALRLRPRFITLALFITSIFALLGALTLGNQSGLADRLFASESFMITISIIFSIIVSSEEDRRVTTNLFKTQLGTLENALTRISNESNSKNNFIAILAHELRNPLAPIVSGIELLKLKGVGDAEDGANLDIMADRMKTVRRLLDDLLDISRIAEGKLEIKYETVNLQKVLDRAIFSTEHHRKEMHQSLDYTPPTEPIHIAGDAVRLEQIFSNLLTNASKYSNSGDTVTLNVHMIDQVVAIEIRDEGVGIPSDSLETIFLPFQQIENGKRTQKGLGIGLALVRNLVELHRGNITATSDGKGLGSRFLVELPLLVAHAPSNDVETHLMHVVTAPSAASLSILIVDDNDAAAASMGKLIEIKGGAVTYAYTGAQAIKKTLSSSPDVVLLDVGLPDQDGYQVAKILRGRGYKGILIALTGYGTPDARQQGQEAGFDHYLVKPAGLADLRRVLPELG